MIAHLKGTVLDKTPETVVVDVGGVGYEAHIPLSTFYGLPEPGQPVVLHIHTRLREDALRLFGFLTPREKAIFEILVGINKVGPKLALAILSGIPVEELLEAVSTSNVARLSAIPGVGRKTAERLALELRDKLAPLRVEETAGGQPSAGHPLKDDALSALVNLGYRKTEAEKVLNQLCRNGAPQTLEALIKESLNRLSP